MLSGRGGDRFTTGEIRNVLLLRSSMRDSTRCLGRWKSRIESGAAQKGRNGPLFTKQVEKRPPTGALKSMLLQAG